MEQYIFESQVLSNTFEKRGTIPVERFQQCIVLIAQPLIGVAHHLCRDERLTVEKPLVVLMICALMLSSERLVAMASLLLPCCPSHPTAPSGRCACS